MRRIEDELLVGWDGRRFEDIEAVGCTFRGAMPLPDKPGDWNIVRNCRAVRCSKQNLGLRGIAFEDCELDGFGRVGGLLSTFLHACVFKRVTLKGRLPAISIDHHYRTPGMHVDLPSRERLLYDPAVQRRWAEAMHLYYRDVDWALDLREARFRSFVSFLGVPGKLIRRDPSRHVLITRERLSDERWRGLPSCVSRLAIERFVESSPFDAVVLAASSDKKAGDHLDEFATLRELGIAEPD